jgi:hypothetical protein
VWGLQEEEVEEVGYLPPRLWHPVLHWHHQMHQVVILICHLQKLMAKAETLFVAMP